jgi:hypothetical protein
MTAMQLIASAVAVGMGTRVLLWVLGGFYSLWMSLIRKDLL